MNAKKKKKLAVSNEEQRKTLGALHWVYQKAMSDFAQKLFKYLDEDLRPRFLILGIPQDHSRPVWLEPSEDSGYIPKFFDRVVPLAKDIEAEEVAKNAWKNPSRRNSKIRPLLANTKSAVFSSSKNMPFTITTQCPFNGGAMRASLDHLLTRQPSSFFEYAGLS